MGTLITGGCICGTVRYECSTEPVFSGNCHCLDCQKTSGSGYSASMFVPIDTVKITGEVKYHDVKGGSGYDVSRGFCPNCGSHVFGKPAAVAGMMGIRAGSLDDPSLYKPQMNIFAKNAQKWAVLDPNLPQFPGMPPQNQ
jgi:hypothetical protein